MSTNRPDNPSDQPAGTPSDKPFNNRRNFLKASGIMTAAAITSALPEVASAQTVAPPAPAVSRDSMPTRNL
jgi:hypothetical protein